MCHIAKINTVLIELAKSRKGTRPRLRCEMLNANSWTQVIPARVPFFQVPSHPLKIGHTYTRSVFTCKSNGQRINLPCMLKSLIRIYPAVQRSQRRAGGARKNLEDIFWNKENKVFSIYLSVFNGALGENRNVNVAIGGLRTI